MARARAAWARLIRKVYGTDHLERPKCNDPMRVIALIEEPGVIQRMLEHLGSWAPLTTKRRPPLGPVNWPRYSNLRLNNQFPTLPDLPNRKRHLRNSQAAGKHLPRPGGRNSLLGVTADPAHDPLGSRASPEEAGVSMNIRSPMRTLWALSHLIQAQWRGAATLLPE